MYDVCQETQIGKKHKYLGKKMQSIATTGDGQLPWGNTHE